MLTSVEKILFILAVLGSLYLTWLGVRRILKIIGRGQGKPDWTQLYKRFWEVTVKVVPFRPLFRFRLGPSMLHALIGWGFLYYLLVNLAELLQGYIPNFRFLQNTGLLGDIYRILADIFTLAVIVGISTGLRHRFRASGAERELRQLRKELDQLKKEAVESGHSGFEADPAEPADPSSLSDENTAAEDAPGGNLAEHDLDPEDETVITGAGRGDEK